MIVLVEYANLIYQKYVVINIQSNPPEQHKQAK
jgi:hypothetical protein